MSGGERQRVALARALAFEPDLLLLDEPLSALDQPTREELRSVIQDLVSGLGIPVIHVTHDRDEAFSLADDLAVIVAGSSAKAVRPIGLRLRRSTPWSPDCSVGRRWVGVRPSAEKSSSESVSLDAGDHSGAVHVFYRPEDVRLAPSTTAAPVPATFTARVLRITRTFPVARVLLGSDPPITALIFRRDIERFDLTVGKSIEVAIPADALCIIGSAQN